MKSLVQEMCGKRPSISSMPTQRGEAGLGAGDRDVADAEAVALGPQPGDPEQRLGRLGHRPVAVLPLGADVVDLGVVVTAASRR